MARKATKSDCAGCRDDYYNHGGNSTTGQCWGLETATMKKVRLIPIDMYPPFERVKPVCKPSCYRKPGCVRQELKP